MYSDIHTHSNPRPDIESVIDISGREDCVVYGESGEVMIPDSIQMFSIGIHPKSIGEDWQHKLSEIEILAKNPKFAGVGECGLDKYSDSPRDLQEKVFAAQLSLAQRFSKPIIIHCVRLYTDVLRLIKKTDFQQPAVFHGYNGNPDVTAQLLKRPNIYFSYSNKAFTTPATSGAKSLPLIPPSRILTETDCDTTANLATTISLIAQKKNMNPAEMEAIVYSNFKNLGVQSTSQSGILSI